MVRDLLTGIPAIGILLDFMLNSMEFMMALADIIFPWFAILFGTIAPNLTFIDQDSLQWLFLFVATLFFLNLTINTWERIKDEKL